MKENQFMIEKLNVFNLFGTIFETKLAQFIVIISVVQFHVVCNAKPQQTIHQFHTCPLTGRNKVWSLHKHKNILWKRFKTEWNIKQISKPQEAVVQITEYIYIRAGSKKQ